MTHEPKTCEAFELALSELLDGELPAPLAAEAVEHTLACAECAAFFRAARRLNGVARGERRPESAVVAESLDGGRSEALWSTVRAASGLAAAPGGSTRGWFRPALHSLRFAALLAVGIGAGWWLSALRPGAGGATAGDGTGDPRTIVVSTTPSAMDERRFVALADELLAADPKFQRAMLQVLRLVPALETGEGLSSEEGPRGYVRARLDDERPTRGAI